MSGERHVVVVGAGITGLTTAYVLANAEPRVRVTLLERRERVGGNIETERRDGFLLDGGPDSFLSTKREGAELCRELGLGSDLIVPRPEAKKVYMVHRGRLEPMPGGLALAIPTQIGPMLSMTGSHRSGAAGRSMSFMNPPVSPRPSMYRPTMAASVASTENVVGTQEFYPVRRRPDSWAESRWN